MGKCPITDESLLFIKVASCLREEKKTQKAIFTDINNNNVIM